MTISGRSSPRSRTRRSTPCARRSSCPWRPTSAWSATCSTSVPSTRTGSSCPRRCSPRASSTHWSTSTGPAFSVADLDGSYDPAQTDLRSALEALMDLAEQKVSEGNTILVISDRRIEDGRLPIHSLLATGAVHHRLIRAGPALRRQPDHRDGERSRFTPGSLPGRLRCHGRVSLPRLLGARGPDAQRRAAR
jgi:hypothetical protein